MLHATTDGLYCAAGAFHVDAAGPVDLAIVTHAHADHARRGHAAYLASASGAGVLRARLGDIALQTLGWGERLAVGDAVVSLHPAGHVLGSAQVRMEYKGEVWVASGDYKVEPDATCAAFEPVRCDTFITESTFGLPIYRWQPQAEVYAEINDWWRANAEEGRASVLYCYSFGKAQRILSGLREIGTGDGAASTVVVIAYRRATIALADEVVFVEDGRIAARGTHAQLLETSPGYQDLVHAYERADAQRQADALEAAQEVGA